MMPVTYHNCVQYERLKLDLHWRKRRKWSQKDCSGVLHFIRLISFYISVYCVWCDVFSIGCFKACPHCRRKVRQSPNFAVVSPFSATLFCDSVDRALAHCFITRAGHILSSNLLPFKLWHVLQRNPFSLLATHNVLTVWRRCTYEVYRVRLKMTQHLKCDYLVTPENFCAKFCTLLPQDSVHYRAVFG